jgi:hypothetical protein
MPFRNAARHSWAGSDVDGHPDRLALLWLHEYAPDVIETEARRYPPLKRLAVGLGGPVMSTLIPIPLDCTDGFNEAYYGRPKALLGPLARLSCSAWSLVGAEGSTESSRRR